MSFSDDWLKNGLPNFRGGKDRTVARKMIDNLGGPSGFKTSKRTNADGSVTTVQLKGVMPPQVTTSSTLSFGCPHGVYRHGVNSGDTGGLFGSSYAPIETAVDGVFAFLNNKRTNNNPRLYPPINGDAKCFNGKVLISGANNRFCLDGKIHELGLNSWLLEDAGMSRQIMLAERAPQSAAALHLYVFAEADYRNYAVDYAAFSSATYVTVDIPIAVTASAYTNLLHVADVSSDGRKFLLAITAQGASFETLDTLPTLPPDEELPFDTDYDAMIAAGTLTVGRAYERNARGSMPQYEVTISGTYPDFTTSIRTLVLAAGSSQNVAELALPSDATYPIARGQGTGATATLYPYSGTTPEVTTFLQQYYGFVFYPDAHSLTMQGFFYDADDALIPIYTLQHITAAVSSSTPAADYPFSGEIRHTMTVSLVVGTEETALYSSDVTCPYLAERPSETVMRQTTTRVSSGATFFRVSNKVLWGGGFTKITQNVTTQTGLGDEEIISVITTHPDYSQPSSTFITPAGPTTCELYSALAAIDGVGSYKLHASFHPTNFLPAYRTGSEGKLTYEFTKICGWV